MKKTLKEAIEKQLKNHKNLMDLNTKIFTKKPKV